LNTYFAFVRAEKSLSANEQIINFFLSNQHQDAATAANASTLGVIATILQLFGYQV
jgi:hypothetical protein